MPNAVRRLAARVATQLAAKNCQLVLAESCTAGQIAGLLSATPGISQFLCGSLVVYQVATKCAWLGIDEASLARYGPVSRTIAGQMAKQALAVTPQAEMAASVTGHLGPNAPRRLDGVVYIGLCQRAHGKPTLKSVRRHALKNRKRTARQLEAAGLVLYAVLDLLESQE